MKRKNIAIILMVLMLAAASVLPAGNALAENRTGVVKGGWLILRAEP